MPEEDNCRYRSWGSTRGCQEPNMFSLQGQWVPLLSYQLSSSPKIKFSTILGSCLLHIFPNPPMENSKIPELLNHPEGIKPLVQLTVSAVRISLSSPCQISSKPADNRQTSSNPGGGGAGGLQRWVRVRAPTALGEDPGSVLITHMVTHNHHGPSSRLLGHKVSTS